MRHFLLLQVLLLPLLSNALPRLKGKQLSLFHVVQFDNLPCQTNDATSGGTTSHRNGTCLRSDECSDQGGIHNSNCAQGFGVCCLFIVDDCGSTITRNQTYVRNEGFPSAFSESETMCSYTVNTLNTDIHHIRLDFEVFNINGPVVSPIPAREDDATGACQDSFTVTTQTNDAIPVICGLNSGQHMYIDVGMDFDDTRSVELKFTFMSDAELATGFTGNNRRWEIKVSQIEYTSRVNPPTGCLQYHWGFEGRFETFNFADAASNHLINHHYSICFRQELGACCMTYQTCRDEGSFTTTNRQITEGSYYANLFYCFEDFIIIEDFQSSTDGDGPVSDYRQCGALDTHEDEVLHGTTCTVPFMVGIHFDGGFDEYSDRGSILRTNSKKNGKKSHVSRTENKAEKLRLRQEKKEQKKIDRASRKKARTEAKIQAKVDGRSLQAKSRTKRQTSTVQSRGVCMLFKQEYCGVHYSQYRED